MAGGGVGEAMLIGAAVGATAGGAGAAIQGGDPLKGALTGGAMGAVGGGISGAMAPATEVANAGINSTAAAAGGSGGGGAFVPAAGSGVSFATPAAGSTIGAASNVGAGVSGVGAGSGTLGSSGFGPMVSSNTEGLNALAASRGVGTAGAAGSGLEVAPNVITPTNTGIAGAQPPVTNVFGQAAGTPGYLSNTQLGMTGATAGLAGLMQAERDQFEQPDTSYNGPLSKLKYDPDKFTAANPQYAPTSVYRPTYAAEGGIMQLSEGGSYGYPMNKNPDTTTNLESKYGMAKGGIARYDVGGMAMLGVPSTSQTAAQQQSQASGIDALMGNKKRMMTKEQMDAIKMQGMSKSALNDIYGRMAAQGLSGGGHLGSYSDGGRMLKGPGDGMSDNIPATIAGKQPARLADGEFVVPADVVSHLGNGSTDAGAKQLYSMMDRVRKARTGTKKQGKQIKPTKYTAA